MSSLSFGTGIDPTPLDVPSGTTISSAFDINNAGLVVGYTADNANNDRATLWDGTTAFDLNTLLDPSGAGWTLSAAGPRHQLVWTDCRVTDSTIWARPRDSY